MTNTGPTCIWDGTIDSGIAECAEYIAAAGYRYRIILDEDKALFIERFSLDLLKQPSWSEIETMNLDREFRVKHENAILTQAVYDLAESKEEKTASSVREKDLQHLEALKAGLEACVKSMVEEQPGGARQQLTIRNATRLLTEYSSRL